jgi:hypothetical protein
MHRDNHYVPRHYLKRWEGANSKLWSYRVLVSHARVPLWRSFSTRSIAYHEHLYTKIAASGESDSVERWLDAEFEPPAEEIIQRVVSDRRLSPENWRVLARFFAAQDVRTPARLLENMSRWRASLPEQMQSTFTESLAQLEAMTKGERVALPKKGSLREDFPIRVTVERREDEPGGWLKAETASVGTDLMLPLGPQHLLFTQIGKPVPPRGTRMSREKAAVVRRLIAEHAHRYVFAVAPDPVVDKSRPRVVDPTMLQRETAEWQRWHAEQSAAERQFLGK